MKRNKIYFASDFHLGIPNLNESHSRERLIVKWLDSIKEEAKDVHLIGDIFDFWFEYKKVVPKGFTRILGKLAELTDYGINIHIHTGNHDMWMGDYLTKEIGAKVHSNNIIIKEQNKKLLITHGDGLGDGDYIYKLFLRRLFRSKICQWLFGRLHPNFALKVAHAWSKRSRKKKNYTYKGKDLLLEYCKKQQKINPIDYYIFGHIHYPVKTNIDNTATYINTGDWLTHNTYAVLSDGTVDLKTYIK